MMTDEEFEKAIPDHIKLRVQRMTDEQAKARCVELGKKIDAPQYPVSFPEHPTVIDQEEDQEYYLLKERLGEDCSKMAD